MSERAPTLDPQLAKLANELERVSQTVRDLEKRLTDEAWRRKPDAGRWSAIECIEHLNKTAEAFLIELRSGIALLLAAGGHKAGVYRTDIMGWLLIHSLGSRSRLAKFKTTAPFQPMSELDVAAVLARFFELQQALITCIEESSGLELDRQKIRSPFDPRVRYSIYSAFRILPTHAERHLRQASAAALL